MENYLSIRDFSRQPRDNAAFEFFLNLNAKALFQAVIREYLTARHDRKESNARYQELQEDLEFLGYYVPEFEKASVAEVLSCTAFYMMPDNRFVIEAGEDGVRILREEEKAPFGEYEEPWEPEYDETCDEEFYAQEEVPPLLTEEERLRTGRKMVTMIFDGLLFPLCSDSCDADTAIKKMYTEGSV